MTGSKKLEKSLLGPGDLGIKQELNPLNSSTDDQLKINSKKSLRSLSHNGEI